MEITKAQVNLDYKVKRSSEITELKVMEYGKEEFDILEWAKKATTFGPNYLVKEGKIYEVLPPSYRPDFKGTPDNAIVVVAISGTNTDKALNWLKDHLRPKVRRKEASKEIKGVEEIRDTKVNQPDKADSVRSTVGRKK